jgi:heavy-metal exporter, HME family
MQALTGGTVVSQIMEGSRRYDLVMRLADADRTTDEAGRCADRDAGRPRAAAHARPRRGRGWPQPGAARRRAASHRGAGQYRWPVDMAQAVAGIRAELARIELPPGYSTSLEGTFQAQEEAMQTIGVPGVSCRSP